MQLAFVDTSATIHCIELFILHILIEIVANFFMFTMKILTHSTFKYQ